MPNSPVVKEDECSEEPLIEINEGEKEESDGSDGSEDTEGMSQKEIDRAVELGLIKKDDLGKQDKPEADKSKVEDKKDDDEVLDPDDFDKMEEVLNKDQEKFHKKFTPNAKALYFKSKKLKMRAQEAERKYEEAKASLELGSIKDGVSAAKLKQIKEALAGDDLTIEKIQAIIGDVEEKKDDGRVSREEFDREQKAKAEATQSFNNRVALAEQIGRSKYENFDQIAILANEVVKDNKDYLEIIGKAFNDRSIEEDVVVEKIVSFAKLHPKFKEVTKTASPEEREDVNRAIKNSNKPKSSASLGGSSKSIAKREDDLTPEDAANLDSKAWMSLKKSTRDRLLKEAS
jgi:hypothetical protein